MFQNLNNIDSAWVNTLVRRKLRTYSSDDVHLGVGQKCQSYYGGNTLSVFSPSAKKRLLSVLPQAVLDIEVPDVLFIEIASGVTVPTHRDDNRNAAINWYTQVNGEYTLFGLQGFQAEKNDLILMNSQKPHSVTATRGSRSMVSFSFQTPFEVLALSTK